MNSSLPRSFLLVTVEGMLKMLLYAPVRVGGWWGAHQKTVPQRIPLRFPSVAEGPFWFFQSLVRLCNPSGYYHKGVGGWC